MIKRFCDVCGKELDRNLVSDRFKESSIVGGKKVEVEIIIGMGGVTNEGDLCVHCLYRFLDMHDPRPKPASE